MAAKTMLPGSGLPSPEFREPPGGRPRHPAASECGGPGAGPSRPGHHAAGKRGDTRREIPVRIDETSADYRTHALLAALRFEFQLLGGGYETVLPRHAPPALVPVLKICAFALMTRPALIARPPTELEQSAIRRDAPGIGLSVRLLRSAARPRTTTTPTLGPGHKVGGGSTRGGRPSRTRKPVPQRR